jgi:hypothetical protein
MGALCQLHSHDGVNLHQLMIQPIHPVDGGWWWHVWGVDHSGLALAPPSWVAGVRFLGLELGGGELYH